MSRPSPPSARDFFVAPRILPWVELSHAEEQRNAEVLSLSSCLKGKKPYIINPV